MTTNDNLIVPVYLNQRIVFDLLAMMKGGIAEVTKVAETQKLGGDGALEASGTFGLSKALSSLFRIDFSAKSSTKVSGEASTTRNEDRIHTPSSLFIQLRGMLRERQAVLLDGPGVRPQPGAMIEFSAALKRNPFAEMLDTFLGVVEMITAFSPQSGKGKGPAGELQNTRKQMEAMSSALRTGNMADLTTGALECGCRAIITLEKQYLNDPTMSDLVDGTFRVVGKVTRVIGEGQPAISLNRKNVMGALPDGVLRELQSKLQAPELSALRLPRFEWEVPAPVIQVLPIAIFT